MENGINNSDNIKLPLHKRTHWQTFRSAISEMCVYEKIDISVYDVTNVTCYTCTGNELKGKNVTFTTAENRSCWVSNNNYEMYEIPAKNNSGKYPFIGKFLFLSHNVNFDYWIFGDMKAELISEHSDVLENYKINPFGRYTITIGKRRKYH